MTSKPTSLSLMKRLVRDHVSAHKRMIGLAVICMMVAAAAAAVNAWIMQPVLDDIFMQKDQTMLVVLPIAIVLVAFCSAAANYGQTISMRYVGQRIISDLQLTLFAHLLHSDISVFHDRGSGHLISRFTNDIQLMRNSVSSVLTGLAREALTMVFLMGVMLYQSWELTIIAFLAFPFAIFPTIRLGKRMRKLADGTQSQLGSFTARLDETFQGVRVVKAYGREDYEIKRARGVIEGLFTLYFKASRVQAVASPMIETLAGVGIATVIWYGGTKVLAGTTTPGAFFSFLTAMIMTYRPARTMASLSTNLQEGLAAAQRLFAVLDEKPSIQDKPGAGALAVKDAELRFEEVSFRYGPGTGGIDDVAMHLPAHKTVALVGPSGGGKSTIMNLILRFYDPQSGRITIDGTDIRDVTLASLRASMAIVAQETILFDDTVRANIAYGKEGASEEEIIAAAKDAAADEFIRELPQGYDTMIGPHGVRLSGGQRQRLAIARAMLKNAPILLLDEATSALDTTSERQVQAALQRLMKNRTTLVIAHRLSTVMNADIIYVLAQGRIVESGTHESLLAQKGAYHKLYAHQFAAGEEVFA